MCPLPEEVPPLCVPRELAAELKARFWLRNRELSEVIIVFE